MRLAREEGREPCVEVGPRAPLGVSNAAWGASRDASVFSFAPRFKEA
jgi:hypothetical protein